MGPSASLSGTVGDTTLSEAQLASHKHSFNTEDASWSTSGKIAAGNANDRRGSASTNVTGGSQPHTHTLDGKSASANSLPPYYALSFIIRIA